MIFQIGDTIKYVRNVDMYAVKSKLVLGGEYIVKEVYPNYRNDNPIRVFPGGWWIIGECFDLVKNRTMTIKEDGAFDIS